MKYDCDSLFDTNRCQIAGEIYSDLEVSHETFGETFYTFDLGVRRKSGYVDIIKVVISNKLLTEDYYQPGDVVSIIGQVRTYNQTVGEKNHLSIVAFAREINYHSFSYDVNEIELMGYICKEPVKRTSPLGREICDIMLAVNRMYNKSDYIPCISWGRNAIYASSLTVGTKIMVEGRLQSRNYRKKLSDGTFVDKVAYEVSLLNIEEC